MTFKTPFSQIIVMTFFFLWVPMVSHAAVPRRNIALVCIQLDETRATSNAAKSMTAFARERLDLNPNKIISIPQPKSFDELRQEFGSGKVFRRVSHDDMVLVYLIGGISRRIIQLGNGTQVRLAQLFELRRRSGKGRQMTRAFMGFLRLYQTIDSTGNHQASTKHAFLSIHGNIDPSPSERPQTTLLLYGFGSRTNQTTWFN